MRGSHRPPQLNTAGFMAHLIRTRRRHVLPPDRRPNSILQMKPITLRGNPLNNGGLPLVCAPLVSRTLAALRSDVAVVISCAPDIIEWRVDFFEAIGDLKAVLAAAAELRSLAGSIPIIFTRRARHEGGEEITVAEQAIVDTYAAVCAGGSVDFIDYELSQPEASRRYLREVSAAHGVGMILSCHHFSATPACEEMVAALASAAAGGADVAKLAVMPKSATDVLELLRATQIADSRLDIPVVTMAMGGMGAISRIGGWVFGSSLTFAVGAGHSAPGQMPISEMRAAIDTLARAAGNG